MEVQVIRATKSPTGRHETEKLRVAAYCRVSTDSDEQESSFEAQRAYYEAFIRGHSGWSSAGIYADQGISGTMARRRPGFLRLIADCEAGRIDLILTKSISRFARNTLECLQYIRRLRELNIGVLFQKENINTLDAKGEVLITIMASISQEESQSISQNIRMGIQYRMKQGKGRPNIVRSLGYVRDGEGLAIVPAEAEVVRRIYREFLEGLTPRMICRRLMEDGIRTGTGGEIWYPSTVKGMLENEIFAGDLLLQKYYTESFLTHRLVKNTGQLPQYYVPDHHEPIVPRAVFDLAQNELSRRSRLKSDPAKLRFSAVIPLTGRLVCGRCGRVLHRNTRTGTDSAEWRCRTTSGEPSCPSAPHREREILAALAGAFDMLPARRAELLRMLEQGQTELRRVEARIAEADETDRDPEADEARSRIRTELVGRVLCLRLLLAWLDGPPRDPAPGTGSPACRDEEDFFLRTRPALPEYGDLRGSVDNRILIRFLDRVTVCADRYDVGFRAGLTLTVGAVTGET